MNYGHSFGKLVFCECADSFILFINFEGQNNITLPYHTALFQTPHMFLYQQSKFLVLRQTNGFPYPPTKEK